MLLFAQSGLSHRLKIFRGEVKSLADIAYSTFKTLCGEGLGLEFDSEFLRGFYCLPSGLDERQQELVERSDGLRCLNARLRHQGDRRRDFLQRDFCLRGGGDTLPDVLREFPEGDDAVLYRLEEDVGDVLRLVSLHPVGVEDGSDRLAGGGGIGEPGGGSHCGVAQHVEGLGTREAGGVDVI